MTPERIAEPKDKFIFMNKIQIKLLIFAATARNILKN